MSQQKISDRAGILSIGKLMKLKKSELVIEYKKLAILIGELKKDRNRQRHIWSEYYRNKSYRKEKENEK